jgi:hypothetical protein
MKHILASLMIATAFARADVVVEQKIESAFMNGNMIMKVKGDQARMDMPKGPAGDITVLVDTKSGQMTTLMHGQKMAMKLNIADAKKQAEAAQKLSGLDPAKIEKPKATGVKEKVGDWETEVYEFDGGGTKGKMWVAKDFKNYKTITEQMAKLSAATGGGSGFDPSKFDLGGMTVKTEMTTPAGKMTMTLVKVSEDTVADSEFKAPEGYQEMKLPAGLGGEK